MARQDTTAMKELPPTGRSLPIALIRAREAVMAPIREMLGGTGLSEQQWRVLRVLEEFGAQDASQLAKRAGLMAPSLTRIVATMVGEGLVTRATSTTDRRRQVIAITKPGKELLEANRAQAVGIAQGFRDSLGARDYERLLDLLERLSDHKAE